MSYNVVTSAVSDFFKKHGGTILTFLSVGGVIGTSYLASKAALKAKNELETLGEDAPLKEKIRTVAPIYIPTVAVGAATIACVLGANTFSRKQQASALAAGAILEQTYKKYKDKAEELLGKGKVEEEIVKDDLDDNPPWDTPDKDKRLFYYNYYENGEYPEYGSYFEATPEEILKAEMELNRIFIIRKKATLKDFFKLLGFDTSKIEGIDNLGWSIDLGSEYYGYSWIDFEHFDTKMEDGLECTIISTPYPPSIFA